jgi:hypothetical protein
MKTLFILSLICLTISMTASGQDKGWQSLFDGKTLNGWHRMAGTAEYRVENGNIVGTTVAGSPNTFLVSDKKFPGDFIIEAEAKVDDTLMNSGLQFRSNFDAAANSGKGRINGYQFELDASARRWSGGLYDEGRRDWLYPASLNAKAQNAFKLGVYNKIRIEVIGRTVKTWLNGVAVAYFNDTLLTNEGLIGLQVHAINRPEQVGEKVYFKNIRIKTSGITPTAFPKGVYVVNFQPNSLIAYEKQDGWKLLFDGKTSSGWKGAYKQTFPQKGWEIKNGMLTVLSSQGGEATNGGDIVSLKQYGAFDLSFEFKLTPGANSGVKYFVTLSEQNTGSAIGLEYQVLDDSLHPDAKLGRNGNRTMASLYDLIKAEKQKRFIRQPNAGWNMGRIIVYPNNHVEHYLNGVKVLEYERGSQAYRDLVAESKYKVWKDFGEARQGHILLQDHGNEVSYRSIKIKPL